MSWKNSATAYGTATKTFHWLIFLLFLNQYLVAYSMLNTAVNETGLAGQTQGTLYNWHKSIGLIALLIALLRYTWRKTTRLPNWADSLSAGERKLIHWYELILYAAMFIMPLSGFFYVMSGGYGVHFFGLVHLPNPIPRWEWLAFASRWTHIITGWVILAVLTVHIGLVLKHQFVDKDGLLRRMLPFTQ
jgi:cytochrome b561